MLPNPPLVRGEDHSEVKASLDAKSILLAEDQFLIAMDTEHALQERGATDVRQRAQRLGGYAGLAFVGTPRMIADEIEDWLAARACDGFNVMFPYLPAGLDDVIDKVIPELQRRGLFRRDYPGMTLRETLGLSRPGNRFFAQ